MNLERIMNDLKQRKIKDKSGKQVNPALRTMIVTYPDDGVNAEELQRVKAQVTATMWRKVSMDLE